MATTAGEIGRIGQKRYGGFFYEEFLKELQGRKGVETYREMADNDDVIGAILFAIEMLIRQTSWTIQPGGPESADEEAGSNRTAGSWRRYLQGPAPVSGS